MSLQDGLAAINLEMPSRVPRTEYSAHFHWPLVHKVTGIEVDAKSTVELQTQASSAFYKAWNYDFVWSILTHNQIFGDFRTSMGHAAYSDGGVDFNDNVFCPINDPEEVLTFDPYKQFGTLNKRQLIADYNLDYQKQCQEAPAAVAMTGIYVTIISGLLELFGWDMLLMAAGINAAAFGATVNRYVTWISQYFDALAQCDAPIVMIHDDIVWTSGAFIHPDWYRTYIFPNYKKLFAPILERGKKIIFTSDGNFTQFADDIAACGVHGFVMEPCTDISYIAEKYGKTHIIVGNADTRILTFGSREEIRNEVKRCMAIGKKCPGYFLAVGNHIPPNVPVENALWYNECYEKMMWR